MVKDADHALPDGPQFLYPLMLLVHPNPCLSCPNPTICSSSLVQLIADRG